MAAPRQVLTAYTAFRRWHARSGYEPVWTEFPVWSERHGYAGTLDTAGQVHLHAPHLGVDGLVAVVGDWKSSSRLHLEAHMQVAAYAEALREMGHLPADAWAFVLRLPKRDNDEFEMQLLSPAEQAEALEAFLCVLRIWRWQQVERKAQWIDLGEGAGGVGVSLRDPAWPVREEATP